MPTQSRASVDKRLTTMVAILVESKPLLICFSYLIINLEQPYPRQGVHMAGFQPLEVLNVAIWAVLIGRAAADQLLVLLGCKQNLRHKVNTKQNPMSWEQSPASAVVKHRGCHNCKHVSLYHFFASTPPQRPHSAVSDPLRDQVNTFSI